MKQRCWLPLCVMAILHGLSADVCRSDESSQASIFDRRNLVAWCIVPFDAKKRDPQARAQMVTDLGLKRVAYDWRSEHVPTFEQEIEAYKKHDIEFFAFWSWHDSIEPLIKKHGIHPQIWMMLPNVDGNTDAERVDAAVEYLKPMVEKTRALGLRLGLYNHGGWQGEPENLVAICEQLRSNHQADHVGIVYNFHHGHDHIERFSESLELMKPYLLCLNLNGMAEPESVNGHENKILPLGDGVHERRMLQEVTRQGYDGPIGILDHRNDTDAMEALSANLRGLDQIVTELE